MPLRTRRAARAHKCSAGVCAALASEALWMRKPSSRCRGFTRTSIASAEAWSSYRASASHERRQLKQKYRHRRGVLATLPVSGRDRKRLLQQLALQQTIETRKARNPTGGDSKDLASRHLASFRREPRRARRRPCDSTAETSRTGARPERHRQGAVSQAKNEIRVARPSPRSESWRGRTDSRCRPTGNPLGSSTR